MNPEVNKLLAENKGNPVIALTVEIDGGLTTIRGRKAWALSELISAGIRGVTPIERPAPRWSHYIHKLRRAGIHVETIDEKHGGTSAGTHARYVLPSSLRVIEAVRQSEKKLKRKDGGFVPLPIPISTQRENALSLRLRALTTRARQKRDNSKGTRHAHR